MKIAYILPSLSSAAPVRVIELISHLMTQNGHQCTVFYLDKKESIDFSCNTQQIDINIAIDMSVFDIVHSTGMRPDMYVEKFRDFSGKTRYITTIHNFFIEDFTSQYNWFVAQIFGRRWMSKLNKLDTVAVLSKVGVEYYRQWIKKPTLTYAYNARLIDFSMKLSNEEKKMITDFKGKDTLIGINAMLSRVKGIDLVIKALVELQNYKLFVAGNGKVGEKLKALAKKLGVSDRVFFAGFCKDAYRYLEYYDIYACPSRNEGFGLVLLESAQYKVPTICSNIPIFKEIFNDSEVAYFDLDDTHSLVEAIKKATNNNDMSQKMYQRYLDCYTPEKMYQRYLKIYNGEI